MKVLLLPGLDGSGMLFDELIDNFPEHFNTQICRLDEIPCSSFIESAQHIAGTINDDEIVLIAESYSGRIAYELCRLFGKRVQHVIFIASFISKPSILAYCANLLPLSTLTSNRFTYWLLDKIGFSGQSQPLLLDNVFRSLSRVNKSKLKQRLNNIARLKVPSERTDTCCTYIRAKKDLLVNSNALSELREIFPHTTVITISGGHFIAQMAPVQCAKIIARSINV